MARSPAKPRSGPPAGTVQLVGCHLALGGDAGNVCVFDQDQPLTYPEALLLDRIHATETAQYAPVDHVVHLGYVRRSPLAERKRLAEKYGNIAEALFPGANPAQSMTVHNPEDAPPAGDRCVLGDFAGKAGKAGKGEPAPAPDPEAPDSDPDADAPDPEAPEGEQLSLDF